MTTAKLSRRGLLLQAAASVAAAPLARARGSVLGGVNLSGLELNPEKTGAKLNIDFVAPTRAELERYQGEGARLIRVPFLWERLQPTLGQEFDAGYGALLDDLVRAARQLGLRIVLDAHQFGRRRVDGQNQIIGESSAASSADFARFWARVAQRYAHDAHVVFNLMNEPHDQDVAALVRTQNAAVAAIRATGARHLVLASGTAWSGAHSWRSAGNGAAMARIVDPAGCIAFDVHQYLDADSSGAHGECVHGSGARLADFTAWARAHGRRGFLGECGAGASDDCGKEFDALLAHVQVNADVWLGWAAWGGGPWWRADYPLALEHGDAQMTVLRRHWRS